MPRLCFVTTCMGRLAHLQLTLGRVLAQRDSSCVVVDYSCPERCGEWVSANYHEVRVVRVPGKTKFNHSPAANAGSRAVNAPWVCFFDCDILFEFAFAETVLPLLQPGYYYCPHPIRDWALCGTFICSQEDFERIGGYDEVYKGWGERDFDVYSALEFVGVKRRTFSSSLLRHLPHGERSRVQFHDSKERHVVQSINRIYRFIKFDMMHVTGGLLRQETRDDLYEKVAERMRCTIYKGKPLDLAIEIPGLDLILRYQVHGIRERHIIQFVNMVYRSQLINRFYRFIKAALLRRSLDLTKAIYGRHLPFGRRLDLSLTSKTAKVMSEPGV